LHPQLNSGSSMISILFMLNNADAYGSYSGNAMLALICMYDRIVRPAGFYFLTP
jgi:hypothetical protein